MLGHLHSCLTLLGTRTRTDFFIRAKFFAHVVSLSTSQVSPGFAYRNKLEMNDSSHKYEESDEYLEDEEAEHILKLIASLLSRAN